MQNLFPQRGVSKCVGGVIVVGEEEVVGVDHGAAVTVDQCRPAGGAQDVQKSSELSFVRRLEETRKEFASVVR